MHAKDGAPQLHYTAMGLESSSQETSILEKELAVSVDHAPRSVGHTHRRTELYTCSSAFFALRKTAV